MLEAQIACPACGAKNPATAEWCSQCYGSLASEPVEDQRAEEAGEEERRFAHPTEYASPAGRPIYSRWAKTETSFGPVGRIVLTIMVLAVGVALSFNFSPVPMAIWFLLATPVLMRGIWKRVPVRYEHSPPRAPLEPAAEETPAPDSPAF